MQDSFDVVVIGAGAAGIGALARLARGPVTSVALEARPRIGGRAQTVLARADLPLDLGCGWLHSADRNPLAPMIEQAGFTIDRSPPHWERQAGDQGFPPEDQRAFSEAYEALDARLEEAAKSGQDRPASDFLEPGGRWNPLMDAVSTWYNGAEHEQISVLDYAAYEDSGVNWRVAQGYGAAIAHFADLRRIVTDCPVATVHHDGRELRLSTSRGEVRARAVIVTAPTSVIAEGALAFSPALPTKLEAAAGLPLGLADKVALAIDGDLGFPAEGHLFGRTDRTETGSYHLRPFGRPYIEAFLGGRLAHELEREGKGAAAAFATQELTALLGSSAQRRLILIAETAWAADPWSRGSYSHALPGCAGAREVLRRPVDDRIFFAGEAVSAHQFSTAHGAWETGVEAAEAALAAIGARA